MILCRPGQKRQSRSSNIMQENKQGTGGNEAIKGNFRMLLLNAAISRGGTAAYGVIILWVTLALTHSPVLTGLADGMISIPLFASFLVGAYVDRSSRKKLLALISCIVRPAIIGMMFLALYSNNVLMIAALFFATSILVGFTSDVMNAVRSVWSKQFLNEQTYKKGTSVLQAATGIAETLGFGIAGAVLVFGFVSAFLTLALIFFAAFISILPIVEKGIQQEENGAVRDSVKEGLSFIWKSRFILEIMLVSLLANFLFGTVGVGLTALVQRDFNLPASYFGTLLLSLAAAMILGSVTAMRVGGSVGRLVTLTMAMIGVQLGLVGLSPSIYYDYIFMIGIGFIIGVVNVAASTLILKKVPESMMARVNGTINTFGLGMTFISGTVGGIIIAITSVRAMLEIVGAATVILAFLSLAFRELYRATI